MDLNLKLTRFFVPVAAMLAVAGCSDNDDEFTWQEVDGLPPTIVMEETDMRVAPSRTFRFVGLVEDNDGLAEIVLSCPEIHLNKTIDFGRDSITTSYDLDYQFTTLDDISITDVFSTVITATDHGGRSTSETVTLRFDLDYSAPVFTTYPASEVAVIYEFDATEPVAFDVTFDVEDDRSLLYVEVEIKDEDGNVYFYDISNEPGASLSYAQTVTFPLYEAYYYLTITAEDHQENVTVIESTLLVTDELPDYPKIYLADVATDAELVSDVYGVPMMVNRTDEYTYTARYYNKASGTEIYFLPQKTSFSPVKIGVTSGDNTKLNYTDDINPIVLTQANTYYEMVLDLNELTISISTYIPTDDPVEVGQQVYYNDGAPEDGTYEFQLCLAGEGFPGYGSWSPGDSFMLVQDTTNPYVFHGAHDLVLTAGTTISFTISPAHPWGWWPEPFWRFDNSLNNSNEWLYSGGEAHMLNGGENENQTVPANGTYRFEFDTHLLRSKLYRVN